VTCLHAGEYVHVPASIYEGLADLSQMGGLWASAAAPVA
jgi:hypothetical protein